LDTESERLYQSSKVFANQKRKIESAYKKLDNFDEVGGFKRNCDKAETPGNFLEGNAEISATAEKNGRNI